MAKDSLKHIGVKKAQHCGPKMMVKNGKAYRGAKTHRDGDKLDECIDTFQQSSHKPNLPPYFKIKTSTPVR